MGVLRKFGSIYGERHVTSTLVKEVPVTLLYTSIYNAHFDLSCNGYGFALCSITGTHHCMFDLLQFREVLRHFEVE